MGNVSLLRLQSNQWNTGHSIVLCTYLDTDIHEMDNLLEKYKTHNIQIKKELFMLQFEYKRPLWCGLFGKMIFVSNFLW
ncbi:hypothetical protein GLW08_02105 [Pontibacillus yanchengensis]|uniref:Uncharacterized protein n=2 Tax=Pontibacillus yanchengensis TaxID=462910 RepID=A0ACC7VD48_9BACI|nr:hypothetical protein [Pontibacillus yanchengensis]MYL33024.1 hypothetical protein [Pontibacillus yanchengensis]MYL52126.1 hypothetical protein [Pontibacillus yanchengensis]